MAVARAPRRGPLVLEGLETVPKSCLAAKVGSNVDQHYVFSLVCSPQAPKFVYLAAAARNMATRSDLCSYCVVCSPVAQLVTVPGACGVPFFSSVRRFPYWGIYAVCADATQCERPSRVRYFQERLTATSLSR
jgi:hypothetical protein